jgi:hypothetical protein
MGWFTSDAADLAALKAEEYAHALAAQEIATGSIRSGLWTMAVTKANGDPQKAQDKYIQLRVSQIKLEASVSAAEDLRIASVSAAEDLRISKLGSTTHRCKDCRDTDIDVGFFSNTCKMCSSTNTERYTGQHKRRA